MLNKYTNVLLKNLLPEQKWVELHRVMNVSLIKYDRNNLLQAYSY